MIQYLIGDATQPQIQTPHYIIHICNDQGIWGAGFVKALESIYPEIKQYYLESAKDLGSNQYLSIDNTLTIVNMIAQKGVISKSNPHPLDYSALVTCLEDVFNKAQRFERSIHMPKIGSGLAGGDWKKIEKIIIDMAKKYSVEVFVYTKK